jgi:hypothetical protein
MCHLERLQIFLILHVLLKFEKHLQTLLYTFWMFLNWDDVIAAQRDIDLLPVTQGVSSINIFCGPYLLFFTMLVCADSTIDKNQARRDKYAANKEQINAKRRENYQRKRVTRVADGGYRYETS